MPSARSLTLISLVAGLAACADPSTSPVGLDASGGHAAAKPPTVTDPTATWTIPAPERGARVRQRRPGSPIPTAACVTTRIFATTAGSNSGDATIQTAKSRNCTRRFTLRYSAAPGDTEVVPSFNNLLGLQSTTSVIHIGSPVLRRLIVNPGAIANNPSRCGRVIFGANGPVVPEATACS